MDYTNLIRDFINKKGLILINCFYIDYDGFYLEKYSPISPEEIQELIKKLKDLISISGDEYQPYHEEKFYKDILPKYPDLFSMKEILHLIVSSVDLCRNRLITLEFDIRDDPWFMSLVELLELIQNEDEEGVLMWKLKN